MDNKKVAIVTGANRGIGYEVARKLAKDHLVILTARNKKKGEAAVKKLAKERLKVDFFPIDVTKENDIKKLKNYVEKKYKRLDVLINNAGILVYGKNAMRPNEDIMKVTKKQLEDSLLTNTIAPLLISQALLPLMKKNGYGRIVNISSGAGQLEDMDVWAPAYSISKTALNAVTKILAASYSHHEIKVNSVCPGWVRTGMGGSTADISVEQSAPNIVWAATLSRNGPTGKFFRFKKEIKW